jgi:hypothetical protein
LVTGIASLLSMMEVIVPASAACAAASASVVVLASVVSPSVSAF